MFNLAHVILKNPNDKVKVRTPHSEDLPVSVFHPHLA